MGYDALVANQKARLQIRAVLIAFRWERKQRAIGQLRLSDDDWAALRRRSLDLLDAVRQLLDDGGDYDEIIDELRAARAEIESAG